PSGPASTARRGSSAHPRADSRGSSAESDPAVPPNRGPTPSASTLPCPLELEAPTVPPHHSLGPHHLQRTPEILPEPRQHAPEDPVHLRQPWPWLTCLPYGELLPQREILQRQLPAAATCGAA